MAALELSTTESPMHGVPALWFDKLTPARRYLVVDEVDARRQKRGNGKCDMPS
jgi:hypothetical protein